MMQGQNIGDFTFALPALSDLATSSYIRNIGEKIMHLETSEAIGILSNWRIEGNGLAAAKLKTALHMAVQSLGGELTSRDLLKPEFLACQDCGMRNDMKRGTCQRCNSTNLSPGPEFVSIDVKVMKGSEKVCTARSITMAKRISNALNNYLTDKRGR